MNDAIRKLHSITATNPVKPLSKHEGREVGRVAATASNAEAYMTELARHYGHLDVEYIEDADAATISRMLSPR